MKLNKKGFTLVELLAVIVVLGIIALIGFTSVGGIIEDTKKSSAKQTVTNYISAAKTACGVVMTQSAGSYPSVFTSSDVNSYVSFDKQVTITPEGSGNSYIKFSEYCDKVNINKITVDGYDFQVVNNVISDYPTK